MAIRSLKAASISTGSKRSKFWDQTASLSQPFSVTVPSATTLYSANVMLAPGTYTVTSSNTSSNSYVHFNGPSGYLGTAMTVAGTASITLSGAVSKVGVHTTGGTNVVVSVGTNPTTASLTAVTGGTLDTITSSGTYNSTTGWAFVVAVGGASGPGGGDATYNSYGGQGGFSGTINGAYMYLTGAYTATIGAKGNSGPQFTAGNDGGSTVFNGLTAQGGRQTSPTRGAVGGGGGGNSWTANSGATLANPFTFAKTGTTGAGGGGTPGGSSGGGDGGIGRGGGNNNGASTGYGAGGRGGNAGENFSGGVSTDGVIYVLKGIS